MPKFFLIKRSGPNCLVILIREAWKMVSNQAIYNCWYLKKAGIIDYEEKDEEID
jgi:hypothetical protein